MGRFPLNSFCYRLIRADREGCLRGAVPQRSHEGSPLVSPGNGRPFLLYLFLLGSSSGLMKLNCKGELPWTCTTTSPQAIA